MSRTNPAPPAGASAGTLPPRPLGIEQNGINSVAEAEHRGVPRSLF
jgi:hypothetical protein